MMWTGPVVVVLIAVVGAISGTLGLAAALVFRARDEPRRAAHCVLGSLVVFVGIALFGVNATANLLGTGHPEPARLATQVGALLVPVGNLVLAAAANTREQGYVGLYLSGGVGAFLSWNIGYSLGIGGYAAGLPILFLSVLFALLWLPGGGAFLALVSAVRTPRPGDDARPVE